MNPEKCLLGKMQRRRLWVNLRKYCDDLFAADLPATHRFEPPPYAADKFTKLGLRHPRNPRALRKFYDNFFPRCGYLAENGGNDKKQIWKPKPGSAGYNGSPSPSSMSWLSGSSSSGHCCSAPLQQTSQAQGVSAMQGMQGMPSVGSVPAMPTQAQQIYQISRALASNCFEVPTPQSQHGVPINRSPMCPLSLNMRVQQPAAMAKCRFVVGDIFDDSFMDKHEEITAVFDEIQRVKRRLNLRND